MKYYLISDNVDSIAGMRLVGVEGEVVTDEKQLLNAITTACANKEIGIVLITSKLCDEYKSIVFDYKLNCACPLIVEMPDRHCTDDVGANIKRYISEVIGIKI